MGAGTHALNKESVFSLLILEPLLVLQKAGLCAGAAVFCSALHTRRVWMLPRIPAAGAALSAELLEGTRMCLVEGIFICAWVPRAAPSGNPLLCLAASSGGFLDQGTGAQSLVGVILR